MESGSPKGTAGPAVKSGAENDSARAFEPSADRIVSPSQHSLSSQRLAPRHISSMRSKTVAIGAIFVLLVLTAGIVAYLAWFNPSTKPGTAANAANSTGAPPVVTVATGVSKKRSVDEILSVTGTVSAWDQLSLGAEVGSLRIIAVNAEEGDLVKKGQPLAVLNSASIKAQLAQAKARLQSTELALQKSIQPNRSEEILALKAALAQAHADTTQEQAMQKQSQVNLADADLNERRWKGLLKEGAASPQEYETKKLARDQAQEALMSAQSKVEAARYLEDQAKQKLLQATRGGRQEDIEMSRATIEATKGEIEQLEAQLSETVVRAPDDGLISQRTAHIGDITTAGKTLFTMIRLNKLELRAQVSDLDLPKFKPGQVVSVSTSEAQTGSIQGKVWLVSPQVDATSRLGMVRIELPPKAGLKPGMFVKGEVNLGQHNAVTVPVAAIVRRMGESFVFTLDGNRAVSNTVVTGVQTDSYCEIVSGLSDGTTVITKGARFLSDHDVVRVAQ